MRQPLYCSAANAGVCKERGYGDGSTHYVWLSSIALFPWLPGFPGSPPGISHHVSSLTSPWPVFPQSAAALTLGLLHNPWTSAPSLCPFQETHVPAWCMYGCGKDCLILIPFRHSHISCFTLTLKCFSSDSDNCSAAGVRPLLQFPTHQGQVQSYWHFCFAPLVSLSYQVLRGSIYSSPLVKYSCLLSAGVLHAHLCLKVYFSCIHGERCTPCPPTSLPSCSPSMNFSVYEASIVSLSL